MVHHGHGAARSSMSPECLALARPPQSLRRCVGFKSPGVGETRTCFGVVARSMLRGLLGVGSFRVCVCVCVCVCVSNPGQRVFHHHSFHFTQAGGSRVCSWREPTKLQVQTRISKEDALSTYLPPELLTTLSNLLGLFPWFFMIPSPKPFLPQQPRR